MATVTRERELLRELVALVRGECPSLLNEDSGGDVRLSMAIDDALASPPAEDEATELREALKAQTSRADVMDRAGAYQAMELRKAHKQCRLLRAEIERLKAQAPPASEALIERLTDAVARLPERHELGDVRDAIAAALAAQAPPASDPPGLVALMVEWKRLRKAVNDADNGREGPPWSLIEECKAAYERVLAYPLPASPQAKED